MHCPICDREDNSISFNKTTGKYGDCSVCEAVIDDTIAAYDEEEEDEEPNGG